MRTDPNRACGSTHQRYAWAMLHDLVAHPLMALTAWSTQSLRFHDWTSHLAWPRPVISHVAGNVYTFNHPTARHTYVTTGATREEAQARADAWFQVLEDEFGGVFTLPR